ncbi:hypothetical protein EET67_00790 [Pseudaminobacter arsenicus]|uniref:Uncharacterized protein n=1 Tax=Borborobacter arsenicus TaxID=1851146 RepID=A0A432VBC7_9HYPH|nr:hypothetical protein [Pseudaminobacter arsenicus]RUM99479.1 hypothetical protein EET67_00790 [Pseudaminobacter arsenicus]
MKAAGSEPLRVDYLPELRDQIAPWLNILELFPGDVVDELAVAMVDFLHDRKLDEQSRTAGSLKRELLELASGSRIDGKLTIMDEFVLGVFFGKMPGAGVELSIGGGEQHRRVLPDDDALLGAAFKTLSRLGDDEVASTGLVYRRRAETIADQIPPDASIGELAGFVTGLATIVLEGFGTQARKRRRIGLIAGRLVAVGSLGDTSVSSALDTHFAGLDLHGQASFIEEIARPCFEDAGVAGGLSHALVRLIFVEFLGSLPPSERRPVLRLFARCFPDAFAGFARVLAEQIDCQYRLKNDARSARRDARRWHEAHAGWKLIDGVLEVVWPDAGKEMGPRQRDAVVEIGRAIIAFFNGGDQSGPAGKNAAKRGSRTRSQVTDEGLESVDVANVANISVNGEHVAVLASLRSAIHKLDIVLGILDRRALFELEPNSRTDPEARQELDELRRTIGAVQLWRRELTHKRQRGEYERDALSESRATGARIALPRMPQVKAEGLADNEPAIRKIVAAAQVLIP